MQEGRPSRTAYRVALRRAAHQVYDQPIVFPDPLALRILGLADADGRTLQQSELRAPARPGSISLRAFLVARSRFAEEQVREAYNLGVRQYVLLGAGLDTFAYRNPHPQLRVFEVDHPATSIWKLDLLQENDIAIPPAVAHVAVDFQVDDLQQRLAEAGFRQDEPSQCSAWLGVVPYLSYAGFLGDARLSLRSARLAACLSWTTACHVTCTATFLEQLAFDSLAARVADCGRTVSAFLYQPEALHADLLDRRDGRWS